MTHSLRDIDAVVVTWSYSNCNAGPRRVGTERPRRVRATERSVRIALFLFAAVLPAAEPVYELSGQIDAEAVASITIYGATHPFTASLLTDDAGRFTFKKLMAATYTIAVYLPGSGELRRTVEVGPGTADARRRVHLALKLADANFD